MKCHYEVLGIERDATDDQIKKSYRKLALQWHPDKNPERINECTQYFSIIQQAYDVLSDAHERAWYDRHREAILRGGLGDHYEDNSLNLFPYFTSSCYSGFGDGEKAFYTVYREVFDNLATEDMDFMDKPDKSFFPSFGCSDSSYEEIVGPFYAFWQSYSTFRIFSWVDKYDIRQAPNRNVVRAMEKENKKLRDAEKKERNEEVRELVSFVRKRDKRVAVYREQLEIKRQEQELKAEEHRKAQIRERLSKIGEHKATAWENNEEHESKLQQIEAQLDAEFGDSNSDSDKSGSGSEEPSFDDDLYCIACEKVFKTEKAFKNHQKSKKHKETVAELREHLEQDDLIFLQESDDESDSTTEQQGGKRSKKKKKKRKNLVDEELITSIETQVVIDDASQEVETEVCDKQNSASTCKPRNTKKSAHCDTCSLDFESRNQLFHHLTESGHAKLKDVPQNNSNVSSKKKKQNKNK